ncbi:oxidoreductase C-terminal domain-containing protein [Nonomuraea sp. NPDC047529]|uniref:FAD-dependent oxidoreductase n=1 Tax=Nonomuraea sp. NPDC047529 TaxID=3155623 RepID=UPI00340A8CEE
MPASPTPPALRRSVVVVGAGFLGTEVAAAARQLGLDVTLVDPLPAPLIDRLGDRVARLLAGLHARHGVRLRPGTLVTGLTGHDGRVNGVPGRTRRGRRRRRRLLAAPRLRPPARRTPAERQRGTAAAWTLLGGQAPFAPVPYFWTDQYDVKIQVHGVTGGDARFQVVAGDPATGRFAGLYGRDGHVIGALTWNLPRQARALRRHVAERTPWRQATTG